MILRLINKDDFEELKRMADEAEIEYTEYDNPLRAACHDVVEDIIREKLDGEYSYDEIDSIVEEQSVIIGDKVFEEEDEVMDLSSFYTAVVGFLKIEGLTD